MKKIVQKRSLVQLISTIITNANIKGFFTGSIYKGNSKVICVPGLNCYSCPGAIGSCPIGSLQSVIGSRKFSFSYYVFGILILFGVIFGRFICGFLCPFGFIQDLLYKIKTPKLKVPSKVDKPLRYIKYIMLILPVILLPMFLTNKYGIASPYFCKWICPAGTLEGGIPLVFKNQELQNMIGYIFNWKVLLLFITIIMSILIYRPFCKYICPLGAFYSLFNKFSFYQMYVDKNKCVKCGVCEKNCKMNVQVTKNINSLECIRCGECVKKCSTNAISCGFKKHNKSTENN